MDHGDLARRRDFLAAGGALLLAGCGRSGGDRVGASRTSAPSTSAATTSSAAPSPTAGPTPTPGTPAEVLARSTVPVLCFHQIREFRADDSAYARTITTPPAALTAQFQGLRDGGYTPVTAPAVVDHLQVGTALPDRPVLLTFDDGSATHATAALPVLQQFGFRRRSSR